MSYRPGSFDRGDHEPSSSRAPAAFAATAGGDACARVAELLAVAIDGTLPSSLDAHIDDCAACCELLREATELGDAIRRAGDGYVHASDFAARVVTALAHPQADFQADSHAHSRADRHDR